MLTSSQDSPSPGEPATLVYEADLLGNIQQALAGLQGFGVMALELIQNADDAGAAGVLEVSAVLSMHTIPCPFGKPLPDALVEAFNALCHS